MRSIVFVSSGLCLIAMGCTTPGVNQAVPPNAFGTPQSQQTSWTQKLTAPLSSMLPEQNVARKTAAAAPPDSISLQFKSGPPTASLYLSMAQMSDQGGNTEYARSMYQKALSMEPKNLDALMGLARMEDRLGNLQAAVQIYTRAATLYPKDAGVINDLGLCYARNGQMQQSLQLLDRAVRMRPDKQLYRNNVAKVWIELGRVDLALAHLEAVYEKPVANYNIAVMLTERGRTAEAVNYLNSALALKPEMKEAVSLRRSLCHGGLPTTAGGGQFATVAGSVKPAARTDDTILPTPALSSGPTINFPSTGAPALIPQPQNKPTETARVPLEQSPTLFPPTM